VSTKYVGKTTCGASPDPPGITAGTSDGCQGVTNGIRAGPCSYTSVCGSGAQACGAWHVWPVMAHDMPHVLVLNT
jgi:hypothetical protein